MENLELNTKKASQKAIEEMSHFIYNNKKMSNDLKLSYLDAMIECLESAYNMEKYVMAAGAISYEVQFQ